MHYRFPLPITFNRLWAHLLKGAPYADTVPQQWVSDTAILIILALVILRITVCTTRMPRRQPPIWKRLGTQFSWNLYSPTKRAIFLWNRLRYKHGLGLRDLYPGQPAYIESEDLSWSVGWEVSFVCERPIVTIIEELLTFSETFKQEGREDWRDRAQCELETFKFTLKRVFGDSALRGHLRFLATTAPQQHVPNCQLCGVPVSLISAPSSSSEPDSCPSDCSLCNSTADSMPDSSHSIAP